MSPLRLRLAGMVMMALLVGVGGVALAQMDEEAPPAELPTGPARFTITDDDGLNVVATDPRMSGTLMERGFDELEVPPNYVATGRSRLDNEAGGWECWADEYGATYGKEFYGQSWCVGDGAYEGLSAIMFYSADFDTHGLIYEGEPLREPPAE